MIGWEIEFIANHRIGHLAAVDIGYRPHVLPMIYAYNGEKIFSPIEDRSKRSGPYQYSRLRNILTTHQVSFVVDDYEEDWQELAWVQVRGSVAIKTKGIEYEEGIELLKLKYPQFQVEPLNGKPLLIITSHRVMGWRSSDRQEPMAEIEAKAMLGLNVNLQIDHLIGTSNEKYKFIYLSNYGMVNGYANKNGTPWEAYLLGVYEPVTNFEGDCIAFIHRVVNNQDIMVVAPEGVAFSDDQIKAMTDFQERFYTSEIIRAKASSE